VRDAGGVHVDTLAVEGDALGHQVFALPLPYREAAVGAHDPPPREVVGMLLAREEASAEPRGTGRDVAVGPHEALRNLPDRLDDLGVALVVDSEVLYRRARRRTFSEIAMTPTKINQQIAEHLNGRPADAPPPEFPITSQIEGELRELRIRFAGTRYRLLYQRYENLIVLLHAFEKNTGPVPPSEMAIARWRMADFKRRMKAKPRKPPRAAGRDAPQPPRSRP
jgi:phage-related protein